MQILLIHQYTLYLLFHILHLSEGKYNYNALKLVKYLGNNKIDLVENQELLMIK